jgi:hypothetical protein
LSSIRIKLAISSALIGLALAVSGCVTDGSSSRHHRQDRYSGHHNQDWNSHKNDRHRGIDRYDRDRAMGHHSSDRRQDCKPSKWDDCRGPARRY